MKNNSLDNLILYDLGLFDSKEGLLVPKRFVVNEEEQIVSDNETGLVWSLYCGKQMSFKDAVDYVKGRGDGSYLPSAEDFRDLTIGKGYPNQVELSEIGFKGVGDAYWTSEKFVANLAWGVVLGRGCVPIDIGKTHLYVTYVRKSS